MATSLRCISKKKKEKEKNAFPLKRLEQVTDSERVGAPGCTVYSLYWSRWACRHVESLFCYCSHPHKRETTVDAVASASSQVSPLYVDHFCGELFSAIQSVGFSPTCVKMHELLVRRVVAEPGEKKPETFLLILTAQRQSSVHSVTICTTEWTDVCCDSRMFAHPLPLKMAQKRVCQHAQLLFPGLMITGLLPLAFAGRNCFCFSLWRRLKTLVCH